MPNLKLFYICIFLNIFRMILIIELMQRIKDFCSPLFPTSSAATFKKSQFFKGYVNQV
jgi:hypothetical protein